jgi:hypothetical protein
MALKKDKAKKKKPRAKKRMTGLVVLDGKRQINRRTGLNRDIPMGGGGGSPNLMSALAMRPAITGQGGYSIQTPDQFKQAQDISNIAEEVKKQRINIGQPVELGKVQDLTNVEAQKKAFVKPEPQGAGAEPLMAKAQAPMRKQMEQAQRAQSEPSTPIRTSESKPAKQSPSALNDPYLSQPVKSYGGQRQYLAGAGYGAPIRNIFSGYGGYGGQHQFGPETAGLPSASAQSSLMGESVEALGSPQGR